VNSMAAPLCVNCGMRPATHICQACGAAVCGNCIDPASWRCSDCTAKLTPAAGNYSAPAPFSLATWLFFIAFAAIFIGMLLMAFGSLSNQGGVSGGAIILIGPIPIILGNGPYSVGLITLAAVLTVAALVLFLVLRRRA